MILQGSGNDHEILSAVGTGDDFSGLQNVFSVGYMLS